MNKITTNCWRTIEELLSGEKESPVDFSLLTIWFSAKLLVSIQFWSSSQSSSKNIYFPHPGHKFHSEITKFLVFLFFQVFVITVGRNGNFKMRLVSVNLKKEQKCWKVEEKNNSLAPLLLCLRKVEEQNWTENKIVMRRVEFLRSYFLVFSCVKRKTRAKVNNRKKDNGKVRGRKIYTGRVNRF